MRQFLSTSFIALALLVSAAGAAPAAHADSSHGSGLGNGSICTQPSECSSGYCVSGGPGENMTCQPDPMGTVTASNPSGAVDPATAKTPITYTTPPADPGTGLTSIMAWIASLFAWFAGVAMIILNYTVYLTVVTMGDYVHKLTAVGVTWRILRDIGNILFIFGFLGIGISVILNVDWYGGKTKMLPMLLIGAIFLNFSLFFTEAVIDVGNLFATQFYTQINGGKLPTLATASSQGVSDTIMNRLGLTTIYGSVVTNPAALAKNNSYFVGFMSIILFIILAFVLLSLAFILIARFVILLFLIIVAPIGFVGLAIPQLKSVADKWWHELFQQTITAPVLLLLLYIALAVITDANFLISGSGAPDWMGLFKEGQPNIGGYTSVLLSFLIAMGLLLYVVMAAKQLGAVGAAGATKLAGKLTFGATAWAGRATIGTGLGRGLLGNTLIKRGAVSNNKAIRYGSRLLSFTGKRLQNRTFDARNMPGAKTGLGMLGVDAGTPSALTAKQLQEKQYGAKPVKEFFRESSLEHDKAAAELDRKKKLANASATYGVPGTPQDDAAKAARAEMKKMSTDELASLGGIRKGIDSLVWNLSPSAFADLMKSDKLSGEEKKKIKGTWDSQFSGSAATAGAMVDRLSTSEIASLSGENLVHANTLPHLDASDFDAIRRKGDLTPQQRQDMGVHILAAAAVPTPAGTPVPPRQAGLIAAAANPAFRAYFGL